MTHQMPKIVKCEAVDCSYNINKQCHTLGITVGDDEPNCDTYYHAEKRGGFKDIIGGVGACKVSACMYNQQLECTAEGISVTMSAGHPDCSTFMPR